MLTGVSDFAQSSSWIFENVTAEKTVSKVANTNTKSATTASFFLLFCFSSLFLFSLKRLPELFRNIWTDFWERAWRSLQPFEWKRTKRRGLLRPKSPKITPAKERERKDRKSEQEGMEENDGNHSFYVGYFGNNCLTEEAFLVEKFSKIQLDVCYRQLLRRIQKYSSRAQVKHTQWAQAQFSHCKQRMDSCDKKTA